MRTTTSIPRIYADQNGLKHRELTEKLIGIFYGIYNELGHGFLNFGPVRNSDAMYSIMKEEIRDDPRESAEEK